jgi:hypothetical protein
LSECINPSDEEVATVSMNSPTGLDLIIGQVVVAHEQEAWLRDLEVIRQLPSLEEEGEVVSPVVGSVHLSDLTGVISQVVVNDVGEVIEASVESEDLAIVIQELFL